MSEFVEPVFGIDDFRKPKVLNDYEAVIQSILVVLFGKPGCYPSIPELGMNIQQYRNRRLDQIDTDALKAQLAYQCRSLSSNIIDGSIDVTKMMLDNRDVALVFVIPVTTDQSQKNMLIGLKMADSGITYNYDLIEATSSYNT